LTNTNHLGDRQLYEALWSEALREPVALPEADEPFPCDLDLLGSGSARAIHLHLKYYADEEYRRTWAEQFPGDAIPDHQDPPFDRDRFLPTDEPSTSLPEESAGRGRPPESPLTATGGRLQRVRRRQKRQNPSS
jgi:hypothetical protein